jgi:AcrR family transcriptional regulator
MSVGVKRVYSSELRAAQARATRRVIVDAAARLFVQEGFGQTTVDAIAEEAGVSRKTIFAAVGGKVELLKLALDWAITGDDEPIAMSDRPEVGRLASTPKPGSCGRRGNPSGTSAPERSSERWQLWADCAMVWNRPKPPISSGCTTTRRSTIGL